MGDEANADWEVGMIDLGREIEDKMMEAICGPPPKRRQTALRARGRSFETVELDDAGKIVEPAPRCCYGTALHTPGCKFWLTCT